MHGTDWQTTQKAVGQLSDVNYLNKRNELLSNTYRY